jgi:hypothetical protein
MQKVSSVTAFLARALRDPTPDTVALLGRFEGEDRLLLEAQRVPREERAAWMAERTGRRWSEAALSHAEEIVLLRLRRLLLGQGLLLP